MNVQWGTNQCSGEKAEITVNSLMFAGINACFFKTKTMFVGIDIYI